MSLRPYVLLSAVAVFAASVAACASLVGADFGDECAEGTPGCASGSAPGYDSGTPPQTTDSSVPTPPNRDSGILLGDAQPVIVADGGSCPTGLTDCSGFCVDLTNDPAHCGRCATSCPDDPHDAGVGVCVSSRCEYVCNAGWVECATGCCNPSPVDSSAPVDSGPFLQDGSPPTDPGIACGSTFCSVAAQNYCCGGSGSGDICVPSSSSDNCPWEITCSDSAQCQAGGQAGDVCCYDNTPNVQQSICQQTCSGGQVQFCNPLASGECTGGTTCSGTFSASGLETTYSYCE